MNQYTANYENQALTEPQKADQGTRWRRNRWMNSLFSGSCVMMLFNKYEPSHVRRLRLSIPGVLLLLATCFSVAWSGTFRNGTETI